MAAVRFRYRVFPRNLKSKKDRQFDGDNKVFAIFYAKSNRKNQAPIGAKEALWHSKLGKYLTALK